MLLSKLMVEYINNLDGPRGVELSIFFELWRQLTHRALFSSLLLFSIDWDENIVVWVYTLGLKSCTYNQPCVLQSILINFLYNQDEKDTFASQICPSPCWVF